MRQRSRKWIQRATRKSAKQCSHSRWDRPTEWFGTYIPDSVTTMNANLAAEILAAEKRWKRIRSGEERSDIYPLPNDWESHHEGPPDPARMQWLYADAILLADAYCRTTDLTEPSI